MNTADVISIFDHPLVKKDYRNVRLYGVVALVLARGEKMMLGTSNPQEKLDKLKAVFPDAELKIVDWGIEISCRSKSKPQS